MASFATITQVCDALLGKFIAKIVEVHNIEEEALTSLWNEIVESSTGVEPKKSKSKGKTKKSKKVEDDATEEVRSESESEEKPKNKKVEEESEPAGECQYVPKKGKNARKACGKKALVGKKMCSTHKKFELEEDAPEEKATQEEVPVEEPAKEEVTCIAEISRGANKGKKCGAKVKEGEYCSKHAKTAEKTVEKKEPVLPERKKKASGDDEEQPKKIVLLKHPKLKVFYHEETGLTFKSDKKKVVTGRIENDKIRELNKSDNDDIVKYGFAVDKPIETEFTDAINKIKEKISKKDIEELVEKDVEEVTEEMLEDDEPLEDEEPLEEEEILEEDDE